MSNNVIDFIKAKKARQVKKWRDPFSWQKVAAWGMLLVMIAWLGIFGLTIVLAIVR